MQGISEGQLELLRTAVQRNQLTGSDAFILEIEQLTGRRILNRPPGRPATAKEQKEASQK